MTDRSAGSASHAPDQPAVHADRPSLLTAGTNLAKSAATAASSLWRTRVVGRGRLNAAAYEARLATCRSCPSGHATLDAHGNPKTCGSMLAGMASSNKKSTGCGCHLRSKARDAQQACPMGHWPTVRRTDLEPPRRPERIVTPSPATPGPAAPAIASASGDDPGRLVLPGSPAWPFNRRGFLRRATAVGLAGSAATLLGPRVVQAQGREGCYVEIEACEDSGTHWLSCTKIKEGTTTQTVVKDASQDKCYTIVGAKAVSEAEAKERGGDLLSFSPQEVDGCDSCVSEPCSLVCPGTYSNGYTMTADGNTIPLDNDPPPYNPSAPRACEWSGSTGSFSGTLARVSVNTECTDEVWSASYLWPTDKKSDYEKSGSVGPSGVYSRVGGDPAGPSSITIK
ncbi:MAG: hypothetical protein AAF842_12885 [Planctomycetota bacterium]